MRAHSLQRSSRGLGRSRWAQIGWLLLVVLLVAEVASVFVLSNRGRVVSIDRDDALGTSQAGQEGPDVGYTFDKPGGWASTENGTTTILTSQDKATVISVGLVAGDDSGAVSDRVVAMLDDQYRHLTVTDEAFEGSGYVVQGRALNSARVRLRFMSVTVPASESCQHQIIAFSDLEVKSARVDGLIDDLLGSLELVGDGCGEKVSA